MSAVHPEPPDKHGEQQKRDKQDHAPQPELLGEVGVGIELAVWLTRFALDHAWMSCL